MIHPWLADVEKEFCERLQAERLPHAILLSGPADTGKVDLAAGLLAGLLCLEDAYPCCGECRSCRLLASGAHPDRHVITFEERPSGTGMRTEIVVDQVRRLIASLQLTNTISRRRGALLFPAEAMNRSAANALLKTLEEPPDDTVLILVSNDPARLPATVRSRCQSLRVQSPERAAAIDWLVGTGGSDPTQAEAALDASAGRPLAALRMIRADGTEHYVQVRETLEKLRSGLAEPMAAMASMTEVEPLELWTWLSLAAAARVRASVAEGDDARPWSELQNIADRNRALVPTPVRKDFLLQDWLIQWAGPRP